MITFLRWLGVIPAAFAGAFVGGLIVLGVHSIGPHRGGIAFVGVHLGVSVMGGLVGVFAGHGMAPSHKNHVVITLASLILLASVAFAPWALENLGGWGIFDLVGLNVGSIGIAGPLVNDAPNGDARGD